MSRALTLIQLEEFYQLVGRPIDERYFTTEIALLHIKTARMETKLAERYTKRVWSNSSLTDYLNEHARNCARLAASWLAGGHSRVYSLPDRKGRRSSVMGQVVFATLAPTEIPQIQNDTAKKTIVIRSIRLHPSIRRMGFLRMLQGILKAMGIENLILEVVSNPSFAYALYKKSTDFEHTVLISNSFSVDFEKTISPGPSFLIRLSNT
jgi:hypothetical protein